MFDVCIKFYMQVRPGTVRAGVAVGAYNSTGLYLVTSFASYLVKVENPTSQVSYFAVVALHVLINKYDAVSKTARRPRKRGAVPSARKHTAPVPIACIW